MHAKPTHTRARKGWLSGAPPNLWLPRVDGGARTREWRRKKKEGGAVRLVGPLSCQARQQARRARPHGPRLHARPEPERTHSGGAAGDCGRPVSSYRAVDVMDRLPRVVRGVVPFPAAQVDRLAFKHPARAGRRAGLGVRWSLQGVVRHSQWLRGLRVAAATKPLRRAARATQPHAGTRLRGRPRRGRRPQG